MTAEQSGRRLDLVSPTTAAALTACRQRVAFSLDPSVAALRRPGLRSAIGIAAHKVAERLSREASTFSTTDEAKAWFGAAWDRAIAANDAALNQAWAPATPPSPRDWPGYALTRARLQSRVTAMARADADGASRMDAIERATRSAGALPWVERRLVDESRRIVGTPDRVEQRAHGISIVDIKSGVGPLEVTPERHLQLLIYAHLVAVNGQAQPRAGELVSPSGTRKPVELAPSDVSNAVDRICQLRDDYNVLVDRGAGIREMADPSPDACRWCPYRVACPAFADGWVQDWNVSRGAFGVLETIAEHGATFEIDLRVTSPCDLEDKQVRVTGLPGRPRAAVGEPFNVLDTDVMGDPTVQRARWSTVYWPPLASAL